MNRPSNFGVIIWFLAFAFSAVIGFACFLGGCSLAASAGVPLGLVVVLFIAAACRRRRHCKWCDNIPKGINKYGFCFNCKRTYGTWPDKQVK